MVLTEHKEIAKILDKAYDNKKHSTNVGIDLGIMLNVSQLVEQEIFLNPQFGITAKNINNPKFARPDVPNDSHPAIVRNWHSHKYELEPQVRAVLHGRYRV